MRLPPAGLKQPIPDYSDSDKERYALRHWDADLKSRAIGIFVHRDCMVAFLRLARAAKALDQDGFKGDEWHEALAAFDFEP